MAATPEVPRIAALAPREWSKEAVDAVAQLAPPAGSIYEARRKERGGSGGVGALGLLAVNPSLAQGFLALNRHLLYESGLTERERELVVLRVSWNLRSEYEWGQHVPVALSCGMSAEEVERVTAGPDAPGWGDSDRALLGITDSLLSSGGVESAAWEILAADHDEATLLDLIFTIGSYATLAMAFNAAQLPLDPDLEGLPDAPS